MPHIPSLAVLALALTSSAVAGAQGSLARMADVRRAITARDSVTAQALLDSLAAVVPDHPNILLFRAQVSALRGRDGEARTALRRLLAWDPRYLRATLRDTTVARFRSEFPALDSLVRQIEQPVMTGTVWATIPERDLVPEGTAYDPSTMSVLVGSLNKHKVIAIAPDGTISERIAAGANGLRSVVGIHVDTVRRSLWVASNARYDTPADSSPSALFAFDPRTGAFKARLGLPVGGRHFLNDVTTGSDGTVYVTDSEGGRVWFAPPGATQLREFTGMGRIVSPNGITISSDGRVLFVADADHIQAADLRAGTTWRVEPEEGINAAFIDGLAFDRGTLIAHHPLNVWRIATYTLDSSMRRIVRRALIESASADGRTSTTGEVAGGDYVFIGNSQIDRMNANTIKPETMEPIRMYRVKLR